MPLIEPVVVPLRFPSRWALLAHAVKHAPTPEGRATAAAALADLILEAGEQHNQRGGL